MIGGESAVNKGTYARSGLPRGPKKRTARSWDRAAAWLSRCAALFLVVRLDRLGALLGRREALEALEELLLGHAVGHHFGVVRVDARAGRADQRHGLGLRLVHFDVFLQRLDHIFLHVPRPHALL